MTFVWCCVNVNMVAPLSHTRTHTHTLSILFIHSFSSSSQLIVEMDAFQFWILKRHRYHSMASCICNISRRKVDKPRRKKTKSEMRKDEQEEEELKIHENYEIAHFVCKSTSLNVKCTFYECVCECVVRSCTFVCMCVCDDKKICHQRSQHHGLIHRL